MIDVVVLLGPMLRGGPSGLPDRLRQEGYDVFLLPAGGEGVPHGVAFLDSFGRRCITVRGWDGGAVSVFVLMHEVAHHALGHLRPNTIPAWQQEYHADHLALTACRTMFDSETAAQLEDLSRRHVQPLLQGYIDADIWCHVDLAVADWAGCVVPPDLRLMLEEGNRNVA